MPVVRHSVHVAGIITTPNEFGVYPEGSCSDVRNLVQRAARQWERVRDLNYDGASGVVGDYPYRVVPLADNRYLIISVDAATFTTWRMRTDNSSNAVDFPFEISATDAFWTGGYLTPVIFRERLFVNGRRGVYVLDTLDPSPGQDMREANMLPPSLLSDVTSYAVSPGRAIPNNTMVGYTVVFVRTTADGYVIRSAPSPTYRYNNYSGVTKDVDLHVLWYRALAGDIVEVYRTAGIATSGSDPNVDPGTSARKVLSYTLTASDISAGAGHLIDRVEMTSPLLETAGEEIYTSPYRQGGTGANLEPPACRAMAEWRGYMFYANISGRPTWELNVPAGARFYSQTGGTPDVDRRDGIGGRDCACTVTSGSDVITGISATDIEGIAAGQQVASGSNFTANAVVLSVGASSVTVSESASGSASGATFYDVVEIDGTVRRVESASAFAQTIATSSQFYTVFSSETLPAGEENVTVTVVARRSDTITVRATHGDRYSPPIPEIDETPKTIGRTEAANQWAFSRHNQPEAVPSGNYRTVGGGEVINMFPTRDALIFLCTDGAYRLTGSEGSFRTDLVDRAFVPCQPNACCSMFETVYAHTPRGIASLTGVTTQLLTAGRLDAEYPGKGFEPGVTEQLFADEEHEEVWVMSHASVGSVPKMRVHSTRYDSWTRVDYNGYPFATIGKMPRPNGDHDRLLFVEHWPSNQMAVSERTEIAFPIEAEVKMQPVYLGDPFVVRQWVSSTWLFGSMFGETVLAIAYGNDVEEGRAVPAASEGGVSSTLVCGVSRDNAYAAQYRPRLFVSGGGSAHVLKGFSMRCRAVTAQDKRVNSA